jgi:hypothetical protein
VEKVALFVVTTGKGRASGKVLGPEGSGLTSGPVISMLAESAVVGQGPDVCAFTTVVSVAATGVIKRVPGVWALATELVINAVPATRANTRTPEANRVKTLFLNTMWTLSLSIRQGTVDYRAKIGIPQLGFVLKP